MTKDEEIALYDEKKGLTEQRSYYIVKANEIVQKARFDLSVLEQKTFCFCVSKIKPTDTKDMEYTFTINEYCDVCGIERNNGKNYDNVKAALKRLSDKSFWLMEEDGSEVLIRWLSNVRILYKSGKIKIKFHEDMAKYLFGLYSNYTQYSLFYILPMRSAYSIRLYELLKSYVKLRKTVEFNLDEIKTKLMAPFKNYSDFRRKVLDVATREINKYTDLEISWETITKGQRKVVGIRFKLKEMDGIELTKRQLNSTKTIDGQLAILPNGEYMEVGK